MRRYRLWIGVGLALGLWISRPLMASEICINEVLYDPVGADQGSEFVELYNSSNHAVSLEGWTLEAGNGASQGDWRLQWCGATGQAIAPGGFFLIAGEQVVANADVRTNLTLQNGPDAVRLCVAGGVADRIGWGDLAYAEYYEGAPAPDVPSGWALARIPDGNDTGSNASDFVSRPLPTPRAPNAPRWALLLTEELWDPPLVDTGSTTRLSVTLSNLGAQAVDLATFHWEMATDAGPLEPLVELSGLLEANQSQLFHWELCGSAETAVSSLRLALLGPPGLMDEVEMSIRVGRGSVLISEVQYDPVRGEGEWVELHNISDQTVSLDGWRLVDASGRATLLGPGGADLYPGGRLLVAQDSQGIRSRWVDLSTDLIVERRGPWPSLNNAVDRSLGYADQVLLLDSSGVPSDYVRYRPGDLDGQGVSLERWIEGGRLVDPFRLVPCSSAGGATPGGSSWLAETGDSGSLWLNPHPDPFCPDRAGAERLCRIPVPASGAADTRVTADVFSMAGRRVATLAAAADVAGATVLVWDGRSATGRRLPTGLYLVRIAIHSSRADGEQTVIRPLTLVRG
ncbi:MAG: lamin tail domain-containing protein [Candidatus Eisenbacteria sp.]|nr:lamin tail domain-containing protein [Candidatus Eisenbacteria bacterium]